jgi:hypothetical protein
MALTDLSGITLELQRASDQLNSLKQEIALILDAGPYRPVAGGADVEF